MFDHTACSLRSVPKYAISIIDGFFHFGFFQLAAMMVSTCIFGPCTSHKTQVLISYIFFLEAFVSLNLTKSITILHFLITMKYNVFFSSQSYKQLQVTRSKIDTKNILLFEMLCTLLPSFLNTYLLYIVIISQHSEHLWFRYLHSATIDFLSFTQVTHICLKARICTIHKISFLLLKF